MMKKPELQPRLRMLAELVPQGARLADIGTDHAYVPVTLLLEGRISSAIASDIAEEPLQHARRTAKDYGIKTGLSFRHTAGLMGYQPGEADCYLIAGMGGETIEHILKAASWMKEEDALLILQPQTKQEKLRLWLTENGYRIEKEQLVLDKQMLYNIFLVCSGKSAPLSELEAYSGVELSHDPLYGLYIERQLRRLKQTLEGLRRGKEENGVRIEALEKLIRELEGDL